MTDIIILGCGFAGMEAALWLEKLNLKDINVSVVNKNDAMTYTPSLVWLPPKRRTLEDISIKIEPILSDKGINFYQDEAISIDAQRNSVVLASGRELNYDFLIIAAGWKSKKRHIEGNENVLFPCDFPDILELTHIIDEMDGGTITFAIEGERPGPGAEFIGWIDYYFREIGVRDNFNLNLAEEKHRLMIHLGREACDFLTADFSRRGINLYLGKKLIKAELGVAFLEGDVRIPSDLICAVGKLEASELLRSLDFSNEDGFIPVNNDLSCKAFPNIYVAGDAARFDVAYVPKVAHLAIEQGQIAAENIGAEIKGLKKRSFDAKHAFENLYILPDLGGFAILTRNYRTVKRGMMVSYLKESIEKYYLYTHGLGLTWNLPEGKSASA